MGFFSKIFKGVKKVFKKIGKGIKKVAMKVGKFMDKVGIVGQIAMSFILPGVGGALLKGLGGTLGKVAAWAGTAGGNALVQGAKAVIGTATKFVTQGARVFNTVTSGVKNFIGEVGKTALNKIPGVNFKGAANNFFGTGGAFERAAGATAETWNTTIGSTKWMNQFDPTYQRTQAAVSRPMLKTDSIVDDPFADAFDPTREAAPSFKVDVPEMPEMPLLEPSAQATITGGDSLLAQKSAGLYEPGFTKGGIEATQPNLLRDGFDPSKLGTPVRSLDELKAEALDYDFGLEKSTSGINLTGEAVSAGATEVLKTAATSYLESGYGQPTSTGGYSVPMLLGQGEVIETAPITTGFGYNMLQFDIAQPGEAYYRRESSWQRRMQGVLS